MLEGGKMGAEMKLIKSFSRIDPRKFGLGLVAGCLLVTFAYFSTACFDMMHVAMMDSGSVVRNNNAAAPPLVLAVTTANSHEQDSGVQPESMDSSKTGFQEKISVGDIAPRVDADAAARDIAARETEEVQESQSILSCESNTGQCEKNHLVVGPDQKNSYPETIRQPAQNVEPLKSVEEKKRKPMCDLSDRRIDKCELEGDVRILGKNFTVLLVSPPGSDASHVDEKWRIKPYPRKADAAAMQHVTVVTVKSVRHEDAPPCTDHHDVPALVFGDRSYTGNYFHDFTDVVVPIFQTAYEFHGEVQLLVVNFMIWWTNKYQPILKSLSNYDLVDFDADDRVRCFPRAQIGLTSHDDFSSDPRRQRNGYTMVDFAKFMRATYGLPRDSVSGMVMAPRRRPRILIVARERTRRFANLDAVIAGVERQGFEAVSLEAQISMNLAKVGEVVNSCDAIMGVHGAGLTNLVFLPVHAVVIQVVPWGGLEWVAGSYFRRPSKELQLHYLEYSISLEESTLVDIYPRNHTVFTNPGEIRAKGWNPMKEVFLDKQDVRLNMRRFRPVLKKAMALLKEY